jgi:hypothetical protein
LQTVPNPLFSARRRGLPFTLTLEEFMGFLEGTEFLQRQGRKPDSLSVDRIDVSRGYEADNIQLMALGENSMKGLLEHWRARITEDCPF